MFKWTLESVARVTGAEIVRFIPWRSSTYNTEPILEKLEAAGSQGNKVLLEGVKTGSAKVELQQTSLFTKTCLFLFRCL